MQYRELLNWLPCLRIALFTRVPLQCTSVALTLNLLCTSLTPNVHHSSSHIFACDALRRRTACQLELFPRCLLHSSKYELNSWVSKRRRAVFCLDGHGAELSFQRNATPKQQHHEQGWNHICTDQPHSLCSVSWRTSLCACDRE
jgi:hypothetical protein